MTCLHCHAGTSNGLALCERCQVAVSMWLAYVPVYYRNLARQQRPGRPNGSMSTSGQWLIRRGEIDPSLIPRTLERALNDLTTWVRVLADDRVLEVPGADTEPEMVTVACAFLTNHLTSVATLEWAGQMVRDVGKHERALRALTATAVPGWYAGTCRQVTGYDELGDPYLCGTPTYVVPGVTWVTCSGCGATTAARDHLEVVLEEADDWVASPVRLAEVIVALIDDQTSVEGLRKRIAIWGVRGKLEEFSTTRATREYVWDDNLDRVVLVDGEETGPARYRLGEVLDRLLAEEFPRLADRRMTG